MSVIELPATAASTKRILLVEHHRESASALIHLLSHGGYTVSAAHTAAAALEFCADERFDVLLCDLDLPEDSGLDLARAVKLVCPQVRAVALSGQGRQEHVEAMLRAGFDAHLLKPFSIDQLLHLLD